MRYLPYVLALATAGSIRQQVARGEPTTYSNRRARSGHTGLAGSPHEHKHKHKREREIVRWPPQDPPLIRIHLQRSCE